MLCACETGCGVQVGTRSIRIPRRRYPTHSEFGVLPVIWCAALSLAPKMALSNGSESLFFSSHFLFASPNIFISEKCFISGASEPSAPRVDMHTHRLLFPRCSSCLWLCLRSWPMQHGCVCVCVSDSVQKDYFVVSAFSTALRISV